MMKKVISLIMTIIGVVGAIFGFSYYDENLKYSFRISDEERYIFMGLICIVVIIGLIGLINFIVTLIKDK